MSSVGVGERGVQKGYAGRKKDSSSLVPNKPFIAQGCVGVGSMTSSL